MRVRPHGEGVKHRYGKKEEQRQNAATATPASLASGGEAAGYAAVGCGGSAAAVGGGILRDVLMGLPVAIMHVGSLYAVAAGAGCVVLTVSFSFGAPLTAAAIIAVAVTTVIRLLAVVFDISLPEQRALYRRKVAVETSAITVVAPLATDNGDAGATG